MKALPGQGDRPELSGAEAAHAAGSRRARPGDTVTLFDGSGYDLNALVVEAGRGRLVLREISREMVGSPLAAPVVCAAALPKGSHEDAMVSQCAQLGVCRFVPVEFERSVVRPRGNWQKRAARLSRLAVEAAKQSGASTVMEIAPPRRIRRLPRTRIGRPQTRLSARSEREPDRRAGGGLALRRTRLPRRPRGRLDPRGVRRGRRGRFPRRAPCRHDPANRNRRRRPRRHSRRLPHRPPPPVRPQRACVPRLVLPSRAVVGARRAVPERFPTNQ